MPWLAWPCIDYLTEHLTANMCVFEYGGGGSTLYFLRQGCLVTTVEGDPRWGRDIRRSAERLGPAVNGRLDLRVIDITANDTESTRRYVEEVRRGGPWDVILIDGGRRPQCLTEAIPHIKPNGFLIFDNTDLELYAGEPDRAEGFRPVRMSGFGFGRVRPTQTTILFPSERPCHLGGIGEDRKGEDIQRSKVASSSAAR